MSPCVEMVKGQDIFGNERQDDLVGSVAAALGRGPPSRCSGYVQKGMMTRLPLAMHVTVFPRWILGGPETALSYLLILPMDFLDWALEAASFTVGGVQGQSSRAQTHR